MLLKKTHDQLLKVFIFALALILLLMPKAFAQNTASTVDVLSASSISADSGIVIDEDAQTHPPLRLTPDKSKLLRLEADAATIIVGNPSHVSVLAESTKTLVLVPQLPGATHFTALDKGGNIIMQRHVIVAAPQEKYVRIRRSCAASEDKKCQEIQVYYCPDMCHKVAMTTETPKSDVNSTQAVAPNGTANTTGISDTSYDPDTTGDAP